MQARVYLTLALALLGCPSLASAQEAGMSTSTISGTPWVANRAIGEGPGIRTGNVEWHPGVSGEVGYDSNYLQRANSSVEEDNLGEPVPSLRFRVTPQISIRTADRSAEEGKDVKPVPKPGFMFDFQAAGSYNELIALKSGYGQEFSELRNFEGGAGLGLKFLPGRTWSGDLSGSYNYIFEPSNQGGFGGRYSRHVINGTAGLNWAPGGGRFRWTLLEYRLNFTLFDDNQFRLYDNGNHLVSTRGMWRFLPKTALLYDGSVNVIRYTRDTVNDGEALKARLGINGLVTRRLALLAMAGWATSHYRPKISGNIARNYDSIIGQAEAKWFFSANGRLKEGDADVGASAAALGYHRDFYDSYLADFYKRDRIYAQGSYLIGGQVITTLEGGVSFIGYPEFNSSAGTQDSFNETRIDVKAFAEYRPMSSLGINLQIRYDQNISRVLDFDNFSDDLDFSRFRAMLGVRWFL